MKSIPGSCLGCVHTSVVGLNHRFGASVDSNAGQFKMLAKILGKCVVNSCGTVEVILKRNTNIPADANAVSVIMKDRDGDFGGGMTASSSLDQLDIILIAFLLDKALKSVLL